mgnify:CR=1 FL=1
MLDKKTRASIGPGVAAALAEDVGAGDLTATLIDPEAVVGAQILARESLVLCGEEWVNEVFRQLDETIIVDWYIGDGQSAETGDVICKLVGPARALLSGERTALNFLQTLSSTATMTVATTAATSRSILKATVSTTITTVCATLQMPVRTRTVMDWAMETWTMPTAGFPASMRTTATPASAETATATSATTVTRGPPGSRS